ncbi:MAG: hypothetical protein O3A10_12110 [Chloroflexi bacterium]|nr:hypothetical protein [Chloroflexota bacterium]MDA1148263.1 hypothetical protein [Chloroflexota bacterium]
MVQTIAGAHPLGSEATMDSQRTAKAKHVDLTCPRCRDSLKQPDGDPASAHTMGSGCVVYRERRAAATGTPTSTANGD